MQVSSPALFLFPFFMFFPPQTFYVKQKSSYFCIFISCGKADCRLSVSPLKGFAPSSWVLFLVAPSGDEQLGSHGCTRTIIPVFNDKKNVKERGWRSCFLDFFCFFLSPCVLPFVWFYFYFLIFSSFLFENGISRRLQGQKPQVLGAFLWGIECSLFCEEFGTKAALLSSACALCHNLNAQSNGRMYPWGLLVPPGGWKD